MALPILLPKIFLSSGVRATRLAQRPRKAVAQAFVIGGLIGATAELFLTLLLPLATKLTQRTSRHDIT